MTNNTSNQAKRTKRIRRSALLLLLAIVFYELPLPAQNEPQSAGAANGISGPASVGTVAALTPPARVPQAPAPAPQAAPPTTGLTIEEAVNRALQNYPAIRAASEGVLAAQANINLARTSYLPRSDFLFQANRATRNNIFGALLPQGFISGISGPAGFNQLTNVWSSATALLFAWEPFDFGLRKANVQLAESTEGRAGAAVGVTRL